MSQDIPLAQIDPDPDPPRRYFSPEGLAELAQPIAKDGVLAPILVRPVADRFMIIHGERRYRAVATLGWETIPAEVRDVDPDTAHWLALVENVQRASLTPIEEAAAFRAAQNTGRTQVEIAQRIGKTQSYVAQKLRLFHLGSGVQYLLAHGGLSEGHARQLLRIEALYGGITATITPEHWRFERIVEASTDEATTVGLYLFALRPLAHPLGLGTPTAAQTPLLVGACRALGHDCQAWAASCRSGSVRLSGTAARWRSPKSRSHRASS